MLYPAPAQQIPVLWTALRARTQDFLAGISVADLLTGSLAVSA